MVAVLCTCVIFTIMCCEQTSCVSLIHSIRPTIHTVRSAASFIPILLNFTPIEKIWFDLKVITEVLMKIQILWSMTSLRLVESGMKIILWLLNLIQSPWRWRKHNTLKQRYQLVFCDVITEKNITWITPAAKVLTPVWYLDLCTQHKIIVFTTWLNRNSVDCRGIGWCRSDILDLYSGNAGLIYSAGQTPDLSFIYWVSSVSVVWFRHIASEWAKSASFFFYLSVFKNNLRI
jgi:hypothetical protein